MNLKHFLKDILWLLEFGLKDLKMKIFTILGREKKDIYRLLIKVNNSCNYRCISCGNWKNSKDTFIPKEKEELIIKKFENDLFFLSITGGEPFLQEERLFEFVKKIKKANPKLKYISINTNCSRPKQVHRFVENLLTEFPGLNLYLGLHYIPSEKWGLRETRIEEARENYKKTRKVAEKLKKKFGKKIPICGKGFTFYNIITIHRKEDFDFIRKEKDLWLGFAIANEQFYNNKEENSIEEIINKDKIKIIDDFIKINKSEMSFLNKRCTKNMRKILKKKERKRKCYAGINRKYVNPKGEIFACSRGVKERKDMNPEKCSGCWTSCESNFDLVADFFIPSIFNRHKRDVKIER